MVRANPSSIEPAAAQLRDLQRRFRSAIGLLVLVIVVSTFGFRLLDGERSWLDSLWDTLNLISTVGSLDDLDQADRLWGMTIIVFGLGATLYGFGNLSAILTSGEILHVFERRRMEKRISDVQDHMIICGFGNVGMQVASRLREHQGLDVVVIDHDEEKARRAAEAGFLVIEGDCTDETVLEKAGIMVASGLIAALDTDAANVFVVLTARGLKTELHVVARADLPHTVPQLKRAGADRVIVPTQIAANQMAALAIRPELAKFISRAMQGQEIELMEIRVSEHPWMAAQTLRELNLPRRADVIVYAVVSEDGTQSFNPSPDHTVSKGDLLLGVTNHRSADRLHAIDEQMRPDGNSSG